MRLTIAKKVHYDAGPNLTALADVALVILIFFMLVGSFGSEHYLSTHVPLVEQGAGAGSQWVPNEPLEIDVQSVGNHFQAIAGRIKTSDASALTQQLTLMREQLSKAGTPADSVQVIVRPTRQTRYDDLIQVYQSALNAGFSKVAFGTAE